MKTCVRAVNLVLVGITHSENASESFSMSLTQWNGAITTYSLS